MGPDIRNVNPIYQGDNNNPPDLFFVMHFHVDHTVRADNINLYPGIFAVTAFVYCTSLSLAFPSFVPFSSLHSLTITNHQPHSTDNLSTDKIALIATSAAINVPSASRSLNVKGPTEAKLERRRTGTLASPPKSTMTIQKVFGSDLAAISGNICCWLEICWILYALNLSTFFRSGLFFRTDLFNVLGRQRPSRRSWL